MSALYQSDFFGWCSDQYDALSSGKIEKLDLENLAEEIRSLGNRERWELINNLAILFAHLLKWEYQPDYRSRSWEDTIIEHQDRARDFLDVNPSLKSSITYCCEKAYHYAKRKASKETMLPITTFPEKMRFSFEWALNFKDFRNK